MEETQQKESFLHSKFVQVTFWILERKNAIFYAFLTLVALAVLLGRFFPGFYKKEDFHSSEAVYQQWLEARTDESSWKELSEELKKNPFLKNKYATEIIQRWICQENPLKASFLVDDAVKTFEEEMDYYASFSQITWEIARGKKEKALEDSNYLQKKMSEDANFAKSSLLYGHNLMRILFLSKELNIPVNTDKARKELEEYLQKNKTTLLCQRKEPGFLKNFRKNKTIGLAEFLEEQKNLISEN
jgi:hypothetical protein